jgi:hypothetical protein
MLVLIPTGEYPIAGHGDAPRAIDAPGSSHTHDYSARAPHLAATSMTQVYSPLLITMRFGMKASAVCQVSTHKSIPTLRPT